MIDIKWIRENPGKLDEALASRGAKPVAIDLIKLDERRRDHLKTLQELQGRRNEASKAIGKAKGSGDDAKAQSLIDEVAQIKAEIQAGEAEERAIDLALVDALSRLPNVPLDDVPVGTDEADNVEVRRVGEKPEFGFAPKEHFELGEALGMMDFDLAAKISGSRFNVLRGKLARLERALGQFMLDVHTGEHGYEETQPPLLVRNDAMYGTSQLPKFGEDLFIGASMTGRGHQVESLLETYTTQADLDALKSGEISLEKLVPQVLERAPTEEEFWLIPTAEVPLTNLVRDRVLDGGQLPLRMTALTPCFRSEAGSAGRDTRGMLRQHQFNKVEMVSITSEETSASELERMTGCAEEVLKRLGLPYRVVTLCTGDMGFAARKTYDIEVWLPGQDAYREISSCSVCGDFQARRMAARYRVEGEKQPRFVHTLNGSGVAVGRALIAVMENYQNENGSITVPECLKPYMGGIERIEAVS
ncbi:serine--tRNA ligase [Fulvimarina endophytica]|uniref:Serine--tRNA ligase n=1 Tax=Fulvimarina endophytica TaxID=2293836 RepID=A0A371XAV1_9HYPH|nr:serine--tRNA ligase [Fulvimarina endophytica]RFC66367.1 serine--tRNA ligase [Fulvimarina endophytica]